MSLDIAIIGVAGRFPGAADVDAFWRNLCAGVESVVRLTDDQLRGAGVDASMLARPEYVRARGLLDGIDRFDADFFGFTPREAAALDPQHRLFLECAWEAFERAGYVPERAGGRVGVYAGSSLNGYLFHVLAAARLQSAADIAALLAVDKDFLTTRVSYKLGLEGPSIAVQSACSTSLVAVHLACQALLGGECELALAGGVSINVPQAVGYLYQPGAIASPDGHCRTFDADAGGTVGGSGVGVVLLKRLDDALADGDPIVAVIKGSAVNNDGRAKVGYTAPRVDGQARVIRDAHAAAGVDPSSISYVEAHGTGTPLGDPIEIAALTQAFRAGSDRTGFCAIGSVKTNVGHLDAAAGIAGLIKTALALAHREIPPSLHFRTPNPALELASSPFRVATALAAWPGGDRPRRAGVSAFGIGGTNAHVVLEEAPPPARAEPAADSQLLVVSARSSASLAALCDALALALEGKGELSLADVAWTLQRGRRAFAHRRAVVCRCREDAARALRDAREVVITGARSVAFLFPGQGTQAIGMAREIYDTEPGFRADVDRCAEALAPALGLDLRTLLFPAAGDREAAAVQLDRTAITQPALFAIEYALARLWASWGVTPAAMAGHSIGEYVAACIGGSIELADALALVAARGRLMEATPPGAMLAVSASAAELEPWITDEVALAAVNGPRQCVLAGAVPAIATCERALAATGFRMRRLRTSRGFHSHLMDDVLDAFGEAVARVSLRAPQVPWVSNVTGTWITDAEARDPAYWVRHLRGTVRFADAATLCAQHDRILLELGPGETLTGLASLHAGMALSASPDGSRAALLDAVRRLWLAGAAVEVARLDGGRRRRVLLPPTPFEHQRYWIDAPATREADAGPTGIDDWFYAPSWKRAPQIRTAVADAHWVVLADDDGIARRLREHGQRVTRVRFGERVELPAVPTIVVHAWSLGGDASLDPDGFRRAQARGAASLLALAQQLGNRDADVLVVARGLHDVTGCEELRPVHAPLAGIVRTLPLEHPQLRCRLLDLDAETPIDVILTEASARVEPVVAYRGAHRWLPTVEPVRLERAATVRLRERGVYVITGGLGGVGLAIAEHLARTARARLVLVGRRAPTDAQRARLEAIAGLGAELDVVAADVTDRARMTVVIADVMARLGALDGVIHAAGVAGGGLIERLTPAALDDELAAKAVGALVLADVLRDRALDFVLYCSSITALSGGVARAGYAAANAFLDALAHAAGRGGGPYTVSVNFDRWHDVGMAARAAARLRAAGLDDVVGDGMTIAQGLEVVDRVLGHASLSQVVVSTRRLRGLPVDDESVALGRRLGGATAPRPTRRVAAPAVVRAEIEAIWTRALGREGITADQDFFALGGESLLALQILNRVRDALGVEVSLRDFFERPTLAGLVARVCAAGAPSTEPALVALPRTPRRLEGR